MNHGRCLVLTAALAGALTCGGSRELCAQAVLPAAAAQVDGGEFVDVTNQPKGQGVAALFAFAPKPGRYLLKVKRGWSGSLPYSGKIGDGEWVVNETTAVGAKDIKSEDGHDIRQVFPSRDPVLEVVHFGDGCKFLAVRKGVATFRYMGDVKDQLVSCELRLEVEADTSEIDAAIKEAIPQARVKVIEVHNAALLSGTVPTSEDLQLITQIGQQFYSDVILQMKVEAARDAVPPAGGPPRVPAVSQATRFDIVVPATSSDLNSPRQGQSDINELRALRGEVRALHEDVRRLTSLLQKREANPSRDSGQGASLSAPSRATAVAITAQQSIEEIRIQEVPNHVVAVLNEVQRNLPDRHSEDTTIVITYPVADLVMTQYSDGTTRNPDLVDWLQLIDKITTQVDPPVWNEKASIQPHEQTYSLVVVAPRAIHEAIARLLEQERSQQDLNIQFEMRYLQTTDASWIQKLGFDLNFDLQGDAVRLDANRASETLEAIKQAGGSNLTSPRVTAMNGKIVTIESTGDRKSATPTVYLRGLSTTDRTSLRLNVAVQPKSLVQELTRRAVKIDNGQALLIDVTEVARRDDLGLADQGRRLYVLIQPKVISTDARETRTNLR